MVRCLRPLLSTANYADLTRALAELAASFQPEDWPVAMAAMGQMALAPGSDPCRLLLGLWAHADRLGAMAWAEQRGVIELLVPEWRTADPEAALAWLRAPERRHDTAWSREMASEFAAVKDDLPELGRMLQGMPPDRIGNILINVGADFSIFGVAELRARLSSLDPALRDRVLAYSAYHSTDPLVILQAAREWLSPAIQKTLYREWAPQYPVQAAAMLEQGAAHPAHADILSGLVFSAACRGDYPRALELLRRWPGELSKGDILVNAGNARSNDRPAAFEFLAQLTDPGLRETTARIYLAEWFEADPAAARQWLPTGNLPEKIRQEFTGR